MKILLNLAYQHLSTFIEQLPDRFETEGEIIYSGRNVLKHYQLHGVDLVVKSFMIPLWVNRIAYTFFRKSKALRSYLYAFEILRRGCRTAEPIACIEEYSGGLLRRSYYISVYEKDTETVRSYMGGEVKGHEGLLAAFTRFTVFIHTKEIYHVDYSPGNILVKRTDEGTYIFSLVDINRLHFCPISEDAACRNLKRLCSSREVSSWIAREYARIQNLDPDRMEALVNAYSDRFFTRKIYAFVTREIKQSSGVMKSLFGPLQLYCFLRLIRKYIHCRLFYKKEKELFCSFIKMYDWRGVLSKEYVL